jgi:hypothetical protein
MNVALDHIIVPSHDEHASAAFLADIPLTRLRSRGIEIYADPMGHEQGQINHHGGGRGRYFRDPSGHNMELLTAPEGVGNQLPTTTPNERTSP